MVCNAEKMLECKDIFVSLFSFCIIKAPQCQEGKEGFTIGRVQFGEENQVSLKVSPGLYHMHSWMPATRNGIAQGKQD